jgi:hypothetical protein
VHFYFLNWKSQFLSRCPEVEEAKGEFIGNSRRQKTCSALVHLRCSSSSVLEIIIEQMLTHVSLTNLMTRRGKIFLMTASWMAHLSRCDFPKGNSIEVSVSHSSSSRTLGLS